MTGLPENLGNTNINELIAALKNARDTGRAVLKGALDGLANNPQLKGIVDQLRGLLGKPVIELTDAELDDLINARHAGNQAKSKAWVEDDPVPPADPPQPPTFQYMTALASDPRPRPAPETVWRTEGVTPPWYCVHDGKIGSGGKPNSFFPELPNGEQPDWKILT